MKDLRLVLDDTGFEALADLARSLIPTLAPDWTDHNAHDPGITLAELIAWISEAQIYALGRLRRDERRAYAALLGIHASGPRPARGLVWPSAKLDSPVVLAARSMPSPVHADASLFCCDHALLLWKGQRIRSLKACRADGTQRDLTRVNRMEGAGFTPFSDPPDPREHLELELDGDWPDNTPPDALLSIGVQLAGGDDAQGGEGIAEAGVQGDAGADGRCASMRVTLRVPGEEHEMDVILDTTHSLLRSGVLLVSRGRWPVPAGTVTLVLRDAHGAFPRSRQIRCIDLNVLPVLQQARVEHIDHAFGTGAPDRTWLLPGAAMTGGVGTPLEVSALLPGRSEVWQQVSDLEAAGPGDRVFALDDAGTHPDAGTQLVFGNGINGKAFPVGAGLRVSCWTTLGAAGRLPAGVEWRVPGVPGSFGRNVLAVDGGRARDGLDDLPRLARRRVMHARPLVTPEDMEAAALGMVDLGVARAVELPLSAATDPASANPRGSRVLVAVGRHGSDGRDGVTESARWLGEIARRLSPRLPIGQRLRVIGPRFVDVRVCASLQVASQVDPESVARSAMRCLRDALSPLDDGELRAWPFGRDLGPRVVRGWLRRLPGVLRVTALELIANGRVLQGDEPLKLGWTGLPRLVIDRHDLTVSRAPGRTA